MTFVNINSRFITFCLKILRFDVNKKNNELKKYKRNFASMIFINFMVSLVATDFYIYY